MNLPSENRPEQRSVLVVGVYISAQTNNIEHIVGQFALSHNWKVAQKWAVIGDEANAPSVKNVTRLRLEKGLPKFVILNRLLADEALDNYDFILLSDDDISLPPDFLDTYLDLVVKYDFALAQPARTHRSYIDHHFVAQMPGLIARKTRFVEIGPLLSLRRDIFSTLLPFDESSPMGWGYDFVWPCLMSRKGVSIGIIDATPVEHSMRKPVMNYSYDETNRAMAVFLSQHQHLTRGEAFTILESFGRCPVEEHIQGV
jgi:hypothetical protein